MRGNPAEYKSCCRPAERDDFFSDMEAMEFGEFEKKYASPMTFKRRLKRRIKSIIKLSLRLIRGGKKESKHNEEY